MKKLATLLLALALCGLGCASQSDDDIEETGSKADDGVVRPVGTYRGELAVNRLAVVVLKTDKTHHYEINRNQCGMILPVPADGIYTFSKSGTKRFIRFKDADGNLLVRYEYKLSGDTLKLRAADSAWETLERAATAETWCGAADDCTLQQLAQPRCPGQWLCEANACAYDCRMPCEAAGGSCVALAPGACADGTVGDANDYSCGGGLGVMCCLPPVAGECPQLSPPAPGFCPDGTVSARREGACIVGYDCVIVGEDCPQLSPPSPSFCPGGKIVPRFGEINGVTCYTGYDCLAQAECAPVCMGSGAQEGWYDACTGALYCQAACDGGANTATCDAIGSRSEGWYASGEGCGLSGSLIGWTRCSQ
jgi:hypothetical protein